MKFVNVSRMVAEVICADIPKPYIVISIRGTGDSLVEFVDDPNRKDVLRLLFDDIEKHYGDYMLFTSKQARQILKFVNTHKTTVDLAIIHCEAGISRSAGIALALTEIYNGKWNAQELLEKHLHGFYNRYVYNTILEAYYGQKV